MIIGISSSILDPNPMVSAFNKRNLIYLEQSIVEYANTLSVSPIIIPTIDSSDATINNYLQIMDGLILSGGTDISPEVYGEKLIDQRWKGNLVRDNFEISLFRGALQKKIPVLGICRGLQIINIALGGTLYQDNNYCVNNALVHRDQKLYEKNYHEVSLTPNGYLENLYNLKKSSINSVHHQSINKLAKNLKIEALSPLDSIIEAVKLDSDSYCLGLQWHPEFQTKKEDHLLDSKLIIADFYNTIKKGLK
jgi:putative glutamine amidotransferase